MASTFVWFQNYKELFASSHYLDSFRITAIFSTLVAVSGILISLLLAVMADRVLRGALAYKTLLIWPYAVAPAIAGILWAFMFNAHVGPLTYVLKTLGVAWDPSRNGLDAFLLVTFAAAWKHICYDYIFLVAALLAVPASLLEAAAVDGAGPGLRFFKISLPMIGPTVFFLLVMNFVYGFFETFAIVDAATAGGPGKDTAILVYKVYYDGFKAMDINGSAAQSVVLMAIVVALTVVQFRFVEKKVHY
jgi:sn-glycerol 3-phosphate transport system permease protein